MTHLELREKFFQYFKSKKHTIVKSSSLVPIDDPTLLFTTAGMLQFKPLYAGIKKEVFTRAATIQKCFRLSDLESIDKTSRHNTFFEMFGNFSFYGDYFKKEAIEFAWEFSTEVIKLPKEKIYISVYKHDDDAFNIWNKHIGIPKEKIVRLGKKDNFWGPAGSSGACGPCSELYIDMGEEKGCEKPDCFVGCDCDRYLEYWNLVFNEFFQDENGEQTHLKNVGIDTGMGLERLCYIVQGVESNYQTDVMKPIVSSVTDKLEIKYEGENKTKINLISDHIRALVFLISEGIMPSNEGRGYVLRRLLRRALKTASDLGYKKPFLHSVTSSVVNIYKEIYTYLPKEEENVKKILLDEENKFIQTIYTGLNKLYSLFEESSDKIIKGTDAFILFDTYGIPLDITLEEASENGFSVDKEGFEIAMNKQKEKSKLLSKDKKLYFSYIEKVDVRYVGEDYDNISKGVMANVVSLYEDKKKVSSLKGNGIIITNVTPFYGEQGGQVGDKGFIVLENGEKINVVDTQKNGNTIFLIVENNENTIKINDHVTLFIDIERRMSIRRNHTTTHILQKVLEIKLGSHINQAGSLVEENYLRFDFTHNKVIDDECLLEIENAVNKVILNSYDVIIKIMPKELAIKDGAKALFGEKYEDEVRTLNIGGGFSFELCGGSHVENTSQIGYFHILSETSIASGVRRIEALTGIHASNLATYVFFKVKDISKLLGVGKVQDIESRIQKLTDDVKRLKKENKNIKTSSNSVDNLIDKYKNVNGIKYYYLHFDEDSKTTREYADIIKRHVKDHIAIITSTFNGVNSILIQIQGVPLKEKNIYASKLLESILHVSGGKGGGSNSFAQGSIKDIKRAQKYIEENVLLNI